MQFVNLGPSCIFTRAGAPQWHWFGPAGDPRGAGIGTPEAIKLVWSTHREIITDWGPVPGHTALAQS
jgi:1-pyrroline-5-carboxylate dehydrogenase